MAGFRAPLEIAPELGGGPRAVWALSTFCHADIVDTCIRAVTTQIMLGSIGMVKLAALATVVRRVLLARAAATHVRAQERDVQRMVVTVMYNGATSLVDVAHRNVSCPENGGTNPRERGEYADDGNRFHRALCG